ncbi:chorismate dehydratase [Desulfitispora alkaliphila]|uniref:menaquinone biosynthetic enzyme MqnA/MqnD family protein n=1 Tax=Desulfitispora alkaliphila TaxID=622674 RepID=UPI003D1E43ED
MSHKVVLGKVDYLNCFPIYYPIEQDIISTPCEIKKGPPSLLNREFISDAINITPISSIEYARNWNICKVVPNLSISAEGTVMSILLFSKVDFKELQGKSIAVTTSSATSVVLLKILMQEALGVEATYMPEKPDLDEMLTNHDAALLIGDDALKGKVLSNQYHILDLGELWYRFTGFPMVYALWVVKESMSTSLSEKFSATITGLEQAKQWQLEQKEFLIKTAESNYPFEEKIIRDYYSTIQYDLGNRHIEGLKLFYYYASKIGILDKRYDLNFWSD